MPLDTNSSENSNIRSRKKEKDSQKFQNQSDREQNAVLAVEDYRLDLLRIVLMCMIFFALHWLFGRFIWSSDQPDFDKDAIFEEAKGKICPKGYDCSYNLKSGDQ